MSAGPLDEATIAVRREARLGFGAEGESGDGLLVFRKRPWFSWGPRWG
jgi:hypothetical protein